MRPNLIQQQATALRFDLKELSWIRPHVFWEFVPNNKRHHNLKWKVQKNENNTTHCVAECGKKDFQRLIYEMTVILFRAELYNHVYDPAAN